MADTIPPTELRSDIPELARSNQLILVTVADWNSVTANLRCFERDRETHSWREALPTFEAIVGRNGLGWGIGLHGTHPGSGPIKREGDKRAPAGVFALREIFGYASSADARITRFPYRELTTVTEGVDDPDSRYYNQIVDSASASDKDWKSSEKMRHEDGLYRWGIVVEHNGKAYPSFGSCIFIHIWEGQNRGTSGCTALAAEHVERLVRWLDKDQSPCLVQLPQSEYVRLKDEWKLP